MIKKKIGCVFYHYGKKYKHLAANAISSFKKWHPDVHVYEYTNRNLPLSVRMIESGIRKYFLAHEVMEREQLDKVIVLGCDTITTSRLDEFVDNDNADVLCTLDFVNKAALPYTNKGKIEIASPYTFFVEGVNVPPDVKKTKIFEYANQPGLTVEWGDEFKKLTENYEQLYKQDNIWVDHFFVNADVVCFNNLKALRETIFLWKNYAATSRQKKELVKNFLLVEDTLPEDEVRSILFRLNVSELRALEKYYYLSDQGALNLLVSRIIDGQEKRFKVDLVDGPTTKNITYNVRALGTIKSSHKYLKDFKIEENRLLNHAEKHVKVWHYCAGFGGLPEDECASWLQEINNKFKPEVKKFFVDECDCSYFFEKAGVTQR